MKHNERRHFIKQTSTVGLGMAIMPNLTFGGHFGKKTEKLKVGLIGVGLRGTNHLNNLAQRDDVEIRAICDIDPDRIKVAKDILAQRNARDPRVFGKNEKDYLNLLELDEIDAVLIATDHTDFDYHAIVEHAPLVIDTRNATSGIVGNREHIRKT